MKVTRLELENFRNIEHAVCEPGELTVICGDNGQGKTNLLEAVWLLTGARSFRGSRDAELVRRGCEFAAIEAAAEASGEERSIRLTVGLPGTARPGRTAKLDGADQGRAAALAGVFTAVVFAPGHLSLVKGSPEGRRKFVDAALCQLYPGYLAEYRRYLRVMEQKNALLKHYARTPGAAEMLDVYNDQLAEAGQAITARRQTYLEALAPLAAANYEAISRGAERLALEYKPSFGPEGLRAALDAAKAEERRCGFCTVGPHREDVYISLDGQPARSDASQGQQRSAVLAMKLAEAACAQQITGHHPAMLLDDVLSELDEGRQKYLLTRMEGRQVFVTCCDPAAFGRTNGKIVQMRGGRLEERG